MEKSYLHHIEQVRNCRNAKLTMQRNMRWSLSSWETTFPWSNPTAAPAAPASNYAEVVDTLVYAGLKCPNRCSLKNK